MLEPEQAHVYRHMTLGQYLDSRRYSDAFKYNYVLPMCAAVWSVPNSQVRGGRGVALASRALCPRGLSQTHQAKLVCFRCC